MDLEDIYENIENNDIKDTTTPRKLNHSQDEGKDQKCKGSRCLVLMTVCLGIICVVLLVSIIAQHISNTAERESYKNTAEEFNQTINRLQAENTELMTEKDQLKNNFSSLSQKNLEIETELRKLYEQCKVRFNISSVLKNWSDSRQYCRDHGGDLVIIDTEEKQRLISSFVKERVWIGLSDIMNEGNMKWVDNSPLKQGFWEINEPNDADQNEDCIELNPAKPVLNNWNDIPCSEMRKCVCEN